MSDLVVYIVAFCVLQLVATFFAAIVSNWDLDDAFWWPLHLAKALLKSLYRALFTEWDT